MKIIHVFITLLLLADNLIPQNINENHFSVEWINTFSNEREVKSENGLFSNLVNLVTGEPEKKLIKPFNLIQIDSNSFFILDQGLFSPIFVTDDGFQIIENDRYNSFPSLVGVCKFNKNRILFTDSKLSKIFVYDTKGNNLKSLSTSIDLVKPTGLAYDEIRNKIFVTETDKHRVIVLSENGDLINTIGSRGESNGQFNYPSFLALDNNGNLYVVDALNFRVQIFDKNGEFIKSFGDAGDATGYFSRPKGIKIDSYGHIFLVDALFHTVQVFDKEGNFLYNFGGLGTPNSRFWLPAGIEIDDDNNIYVADSYNARIQTFRLVDDKN